MTIDVRSLALLTIRHLHFSLLARHISIQPRPSTQIPSSQKQNGIHQHHIAHGISHRLIHQRGQNTQPAQCNVGTIVTRRPSQTGIRSGDEVVEFWTEEDCAVTVSFEVDSNVKVVMGGGVDEFNSGFCDYDICFDDILQKQEEGMHSNS